MTTELSAILSPTTQMAPRAVNTGAATPEGLVPMQRERSAEVAWAAGLFEGEGYWYYHDHSVRAGLSMVDFDTVERFHMIVGVGRLKIKKRQQAHWRDQLYWHVTDRAGVTTVLDMFRPWLSPRRLARGEEILRLQADATHQSAAARSARCKNGHVRIEANRGSQVSPWTGQVTENCRECGREAVRRYRRRKDEAALAASLESALDSERNRRG